MKKLYGAALALVLVVPGAVAASQAVSTLEEIVVTATRSEQRYEKVPATVTVITAEEISRSTAQTVPELLENLPGISVIDLTGTGLHQKVDIGGFGDTADRHVAVTVNGRKLNPVDLSNISWATLPLENIERIEVLYGAGSVLYGDDAMGGVINIITRQAKEEGVQSSATLGLGNFNTRKGSAVLDVVEGKAAIHAGYAYHETDGYREHSSSNRKSFFSNLQFDASEETAAFVEIRLNSDEYELPDALTRTQLEADRRQASPDSTGQGDGQEATLSAGGEHRLTDASTIKLNVSYRDEDRESNWQGVYFSFPWSSSSLYESETIGFNPQYIFKSTISGRENRLIAGVDYYDTDYESTSSYGYQFDVSREAVSVYVQNELQVAPALLVNIGARYEMPDYDMEFSNTSGVARSGMDDEEWAVNMGLSYVFAPKSKIYGRVFRSFRYPRVDEFVSLFNGSFNSNLSQESAIGYEAGIHWAALDNLEVGLRAVLTDVDDEIAYNDASGLNENLDDIRRINTECTMRYGFMEMMTVYGGLAYLNAEFTEGVYDSRKVPLVPEWKGNIGIEVSPLKAMTARVQYNHVDRRYLGNDFANVQTRLDDYQTVDVLLDYIVNSNIELYASARNIFNEKYENGYYDTWGGLKYYPMPESVYMAGLRLRF